MSFLSSLQEEISFRLNENLERIEKCLGLLTDEEIWWSPNENSNSVGNQLLHLEGNIRQYIVCGIGGREDKREREKEFTRQGGLTKSELFQSLKKCIQESLIVISDMNEKEILDIRKVQVYELSGLGILIHVCEHFSYHTGQIAQLYKLLKNSDLGFYAGIDLN